jgi:hypothetical protein
MKTRISPGTGEQGTTLLVALFLTTILAVTIAGYLRHAYQQHYLSMRSQVWNTSMATTEAGIEEALQHLNANPTNLSANGWVKSGSLYTMTRDLTPKARYVVTIDAANLEKPEISSVRALGLFCRRAFPRLHRPKQHRSEGSSGGRRQGGPYQPLCQSHGRQIHH